jgi:phosphohistidine phosphatase
LNRIILKELIWHSSPSLLPSALHSRCEHVMPNMRHIILFRHANAEAQAASGADIDRKLSAIGEKQAATAAAWLKEHLHDAPRIIASPSERTRATTAALVAAYPKANVHFVADIYEASPAKLMAVLDADTHTPLVLVGHNPGLESVLALLTTGQSSAVRGMTPGAIAWLTAPLGGVSPGCAELKLFWRP